MKKAHEMLNDILVILFNEILDIEEEALCVGEFSDISVNDMHIMEAIGLEEPQNMSSVAKKMSVTMGTLTVCMNSLVKKKYVERTRSDEDRRVVYLSLLPKGERACAHHAAFHAEMIEAVEAGMDEKEMKVLIGSLNRLEKFFQKYMTLEDKVIDN
jgi:Transcriptional regulators